MRGPKRWLVKAFTYRVLCFLSLGVVMYIITGELIESAVISIVFNTIQTGIYILHEWAWDRKWKK